MNYGDLPTRELRVVGAGALEHGAALKFWFERGDETVEGFVLRVQDEWVAYRNQCRHWTVDLDHGEGRFWSEKLRRIYCRTHGALFRPEDGFCDGGPCQGQSLEKFELRMDGEDAIVTVYVP